MAKTVVTCTCKVCNETFTKVKSDCHNRREADSWEEWGGKTDAVGGMMVLKKALLPEDVLTLGGDGIN